MEYKFYYHARRKVIIQGGDCVEDLESYEFGSSPNQLIGRRRATTGSKATIMDKEKHSMLRVVVNKKNHCSSGGYLHCHSIVGT
jgi:hypothetical protein